MRSWQGIYLTYRSGRHIHAIYHVYTMYIPYIYYVYIIHIQTLHLSLVYTMYIPCIYISYPCMIIWYCMTLFIAGFRGTYRPTAPPNLGLEDNRPDVHDEADFDIPDTQAVLERFMSNMSKLADDEYQSLSDLLDSLPDPSSYTTAKTIQRLLNQDGTARDRCKDRVRFWWQILCLYFIYAWHILCIYYVYQRILNWISIVYVMYIPSKFFGYAWHIPCIYYVYQRILNWISRNFKCDI